MEALRASASTFQDDLLDENCSSSSSFSYMTQAFSQRISELQQLVCFRVEDSVKHIFVRDIQGIEASVRALEQLFDELRQRTQQEMASVPKVRSKAADKRRKDGPAAARPVPAAAPRWYVTAAELASVPSYIKGRLTLEKVNAAVDELAGFAEACAKAMASVARNQLARVGAEERIRLQELYHSIANKEAAKGRFWFLENDLRAGTAVKMDKSGKSMLMLLRHLGRLQELRAVLDSMGSVTAYVLQAQA
ncbi:hypothetical protein OEZ86_007588 [Tetradesmus obliquus]|nr:hypothetical protein OEZ86_007588 [Tetradesmus obliquus]